MAGRWNPGLQRNPMPINPMAEDPFLQNREQLRPVEYPGLSSRANHNAINHPMMERGRGRTGGLLPNPNVAQYPIREQGNFSDKYIEQQLIRKKHEQEQPNHILLFTIFNPTYPITCDILHKICSPIGKVIRIVIFKKNGMQAMVEFDGVDAAKSAMASLHGYDIYPDCCTLKIEYTQQTKLNVFKNGALTYDYTKPEFEKDLGASKVRRPEGLLPTPEVVEHVDPKPNQYPITEQGRYIHTNTH